MGRHRRLVGLVVAGPVLALVACAGPSPSYAGRGGTSGDPPPPGAFSARVERVVDGDTFIAVRRGERLRVRLIGVDAPESVKPGAPVECWGLRASQVLTAMLAPGTRVTAAYEAGGHLDQYGRELWDVWRPDGILVQAALVRRGAAVAFAYRPQVEHAARLARVEAVARSRGRGLWGHCATVPT